MKKIRAGIVGGTGYAAHELIKILSRHPMADIGFITSKSETGKKVSAYFPDLPADLEMQFEPPNQNEFQSADVVFLCTPHGESQKWVPKILESGSHVIDLSGDYRLRSSESYEHWYAAKHTDEANLVKAVYGLPEIYKNQIRGADLIANPGCYPTGALLSLIPLLKAGAIRPDKLIIDAKSAVSGAGKKPSQITHFVEANENLTPYAPGHSHRHIGEIEQELQRAVQEKTAVIFVPQLVPINRGILETIYIDRPVVKNQTECIDILKDFYRAAPFVRVLENQLPNIRMTAGTNRCAIGAVYDDDTDVLILINSFDNLLKGASGQAVQNMNISFGFDETTGLI
ncbi:N-acetyl-gamma-glutamyl-phosphate reductase [bacterium BMS3Abin05]|nr:N-acetyl-gamma-glutamyl-phosphate reductase [bacterium BMS3Abin05]GBE27139.1 N-acetyl-gamma-glutamyl-phosphate reductase [bacterium BMS3Bbin03]HDZ10785.1 N-acetyl-gamma-glutamyl-phosphate reductase [Bacteroidota bacterium]